MAKLMFEIEDIEGGKMRIDLRGEGLATGETMLENTVTQNTAILLIATLRGVGIGVDQLPDLTPNGTKLTGG